jgi:heme A synthase
MGLAPVSSFEVMKLDRFAKYAWGVLGYSLLVILWGAYVRASGSGAGCGSHWPLCNGEVVPRAPEVETLIELAHRLTSALAGVLVIVLLVWAFRAYPKGHRVRRGAAWSFFFIITEGLVGAGLVLLEYVALNDSVGRVIWIGLHLNNTFLLVAVLALTAWWASGGEGFTWRGQGKVAWLLGLALAGMMVLSTSGAITALGDTLFRVDTLAEGLARDFSPTAHMLENLRIWHPVLAVVVGAFFFLTARYVAHRRPGPRVLRSAQAVQLLFFGQLILGLVNVYLLAPVWLQLVHLLVADLLWVSLVLLSATALTEGVQQVEFAEVRRSWGF